MPEKHKTHKILDEMYCIGCGDDLSEDEVATSIEISKPSGDTEPLPCPFFRFYEDIDEGVWRICHPWPICGTCRDNYVKRKGPEGWVGKSVIKRDWLVQAAAAYPDRDSVAMTKAEGQDA